ncbi:hypothetical protein JCM9279_000924 [Rhodotorula babjevae]
MLRRTTASSTSLWAAAASPAPRRAPIPRPHRRPLSVAAPALSHVGSAPISLPSTVDFIAPPRPSAATPPGSSAPAPARLRGPKGELAVDIAPFIRLDLVDHPASSSSSSSRLVRVAVDDAALKHQRAVWGLTRSLLANAVVGVSEGYTLPLRLVGVGYRATVEPAPHLGPARHRLNLKLGFAHPVLVDLPPDVAASTPSPTSILLAGIDKQRLGQVAARIRSWRVPEPYNGKGIFVGDEQVRRKEVKKK